VFQVAGGSVGLGLTTTVFVTASEDRLQKDLAGTRLDSGEVDTRTGHWQERSRPLRYWRASHGARRIVFSS
jgi:hypothetical protein